MRLGTQVTILVAAMFKSGDVASGGAVRSDAQAYTDAYNFVQKGVTAAAAVDETNRAGGKVLGDA